MPRTGIYRKDRAETLPTHALAFDLCASCGLVKQREPFANRDYTEVNRPPKRRLPPYVATIVNTVRSASVVPGDLILEIGCNDGAFLNALRGAGFNRLLGVEPSKQLCAAARLNGVTVMDDYFTANSAAQILQSFGAPKAVICRHTLEHVPDVQRFVDGIRRVAEPGSAVTIIEVPDSSVITDRGYFFELWDEHLYYFHDDNLARLMAGRGFEVATSIAVEHQETRNLLMTLRPMQTADAVTAPSSPAVARAAWRAFGSRWSVFREKLLRAIIEARRPVYLIGAGHLQTNLVNFLGPGAGVDCLIDDDPEKDGRIAPVASGPGQIISTDDFLERAKTGTVIASGFGYPAWSEKILERARQLGLAIIDPRKTFNELVDQEPSGAADNVDG